MTTSSLIPENTAGKPLDIHHEVTENNLEEALDTFKRACKRLQNPPVWHKLAGFESADFEITTNGNDEPERLMQVNDLLKINIPGPGNYTGGGFDWVEVIAMENNIIAGADESFAIVLKPAKNPENDDKGVAHFFTADASSTFIIHRSGLTIHADYYGRNEVPNLKNVGFLDTLRNGIIAVGAFAGFSNLQWDGLVKGLLAKEIGGMDEIED